jgi:hypothetical protein
MTDIQCCPGRYPGSTPIFAKRSSDGARALLVLLDGSGSWGFGAEAANACFARLDASKIDYHATVGDVHAELEGALAHAPQEWEEEGYDFSLAILIVAGNTAVVAARGGLAVTRLLAGGGREFVHLPQRLVDQLRDRGVDHSVLSNHPGRHILVGPFVSGLGSLPSPTYVQAEQGDRLVVSSYGLADLKSELRGDACTLRDTLDRAGFFSRPTAIISFVRP